MAFTVNNTEVRFEPENPEYLEHLNALPPEMDKLQSRLRRACLHLTKENPYEVALAVDRIMRDRFDALLGEKVCESIFGTTLLTGICGGAPAWLNLLEGLFSQIKPGDMSKPNKAIIKKYANWRRKYGGKI